VSVAEFVAYSAFDGPDSSPEKVARTLSQGGARAESAAAVLKRANGGVDAVRAIYKDLDAPGRALAMDVGASAACEKGAPLLALGLADPDHEVVRKGREKLERCGKSAAPALIGALKSGSPQTRAAAAALLAEVSPREALGPLADALGEDDAVIRTAGRKALAHAARNADKSALAALLSDTTRPANARLEVLRALEGRLSDLRAEADRAIEEIATPNAAMRTRYLLAAPLASLAQGGDATASARLVSMVESDPDGPVRARVAEVLAAVPSAGPALVKAASDPQPRVREAALRSIGSARTGVGEASARARLVDDPWTFVRVAAAGALSSLPSSPSANASLAAALKDRRPRVRAAAIMALAAHRATDQARALVGRLVDEAEDVEVKSAAARALGQICARDAVDTLTKLAKIGASSVADDDERAVGLASIEALGHLRPPDLAKRLSEARAADANAYARQAAAHALAEKDVCR
jgi:HEAT repeat protein